MEVEEHVVVVGEVHVELAVVLDEAVEPLDNDLVFGDQIFDARLLDQFNRLGATLLLARRPRERHDAQRVVLADLVADGHDVLPRLVEVLRVKS